MFNLDPAKLFVIFVIAVVFVGPERLPKLARQLGGAMRTASALRDRVETEIRGAVPDLGLPSIPKSPSAAVSRFIDGLVRPADTKDPTVPQATTDAVDAEVETYAPVESGAASNSDLSEVAATPGVISSTGYNPGMN